MAMQPATPAPVGVDGDVEADADALAVIETADEGTPVLKADQPKLGPQMLRPTSRADRTDGAGRQDRSE